MTRDELKALNEQLDEINSTANEIDWLERCTIEIEKCEPRQLLYFLHNKGSFILDEDCLNKIKAIVYEWMKSRKEQLIDKLHNFNI